MHLHSISVIALITKKGTNKIREIIPPVIHKTGADKLWNANLKRHPD
jgi:hypothetical protein